MAEHESTHAKQQPARAQASNAAPSPKAPGNQGHYCRILHGRPKGKGVAEIAISTMSRPEIEVGMKGVLMGHPGTLTIVSMRPGVATATLEGKGVEKLDYGSVVAIVDPSQTMIDANESNLANPPKVDLAEAKARWASRGVGSSGTGGGPR